MRRERLGWPFLPTPDAQGRLRFPETLDESVTSSIRLILSTRPGEQLAHPEFGVGLDLYRQGPGDLSVRREIHDRIVEQLRAWEPRIELDRVEVAELESDPSRLRIDIAYRLRRTGVAARLGVTLATGA